jgi:hypothetical protein
MQMSLRTFTENVINLAAENCLICDISSILTLGIVDRMSQDSLKKLAAESEDVQLERTTLQDQVEVLRDGLNKCQSHRPREKTGLSSAMHG